MTVSHPYGPTREDASAFLSKMSKSALVYAASGIVMSAHPLSTWRKDELIVALLDHYYRPMTARPISVTITMTETVTYEVTLTYDKLAELLDAPQPAVPFFIASVHQWSASGPIDGNSALLDLIDSDTYRAGSEDRYWAVRNVS